MTNVDELRKAAKCVYLACDESVANDISSKLIWAADKIEQLADDCARLTIERNAAVEKAEALELASEELTYIIQKAAHRRCDYCILRTEPCSARGLNAECSFEYAGEVAPARRRGEGGRTCD